MVKTYGKVWAVRKLRTIWGHGAYVAPDWTADWLHREAVLILDEWGF